MSKEYMGDGVYADFQNDMIKLTAENGIEATNTIWLEDFVMASLQGYAKKVWGQEKTDE